MGQRTSTIYKGKYNRMFGVLSLSDSSTLPHTQRIAVVEWDYGSKTFFSVLTQSQSSTQFEQVAQLELDEQSYGTASISELNPTRFLVSCSGFKCVEVLSLDTDNNERGRIRGELLRRVTKHTLDENTQLRYFCLAQIQQSMLLVATLQGIHNSYVYLVRLQYILECILSSVLYLCVCIVDNTVRVYKVLQNGERIDHLCTSTPVPNPIRLLWDNIRCKLLITNSGNSINVCTLDPNSGQIQSTHTLIDQQTNLNIQCMCWIGSDNNEPSNSRIALFDSNKRELVILSLV